MKSSVGTVVPKPETEQSLAQMPLIATPPPVIPVVDTLPVEKLAFKSTINSVSFITIPNIEQALCNLITIRPIMQKKLIIFG